MFIDEIHVLLDPNGSFGGSAANLLKPELARGELTVIGATTNEEYRLYIEPDEAFSRRFEKLLVEEPDERIAVRMMETLLPYYIEHHEIEIVGEGVEECVRLAKRYVKDRRLPDASIDLMDRTMASIRMTNEASEEELQKSQEELDAIVKEVEEKENSEALKDLLWFHEQLKNKTSPILLQQLDDEVEVDNFNSKETFIQHLQETLDKLKTLAKEKKDAVLASDVAAIISYKTGIPLGKIQSKERDRLLNMEDELRKRVVGQDHALQSLSEAILESRSGITKAGQPIGSFFLSGPTGTGKTELAKSVAEFLFNDESALIRFDMSEFKEEHSAALLYGAPPGYVGYKEGGLLVNKIRQQPYAVVLFDEIEKAHPSVFDLFLQILDEGKLHDKLDREGDFSNAIILFTSNIGSEWVVEQFEKGDMPPSNDLREIMGNYFRPEFLGRLTEIIPFAPISEEVIIRIFNIHLKKLVSILAKKGIELNISDEAKKMLAHKGYTPKYGARPLKGVIRTELRKPISKMIIVGKVSEGTKINVTLDDEKQLNWEIN